MIWLNMPLRGMKELLFPGAIDYSLFGGLTLGTFVLPCMAKNTQITVNMKRNYLLQREANRDVTFQNLWPTMCDDYVHSWSNNDTFKYIFKLLTKGVIFWIKLYLYMHIIRDTNSIIGSVFELFPYYITNTSSPSEMMPLKNISL